MSAAFVSRAPLQPNEGAPHPREGPTIAAPEAVIRQGMWSKDEDDDLRRGVAALGEKAWKQIAEEFMASKRSGKQCRERWRNHLSPDVNKTRFTAEEDRIIIESQSELGNKWAQIARRLPGRPENAVKNRWNLVLKKNIEHTAGPSTKAKERKSKGWKQASHNGTFVVPSNNGIYIGGLPPQHSQSYQNGLPTGFNANSDEKSGKNGMRTRGHRGRTTGPNNAILDPSPRTRSDKRKDGGSDTGSDDSQSLLAKRGLQDNLRLDMNSRSRRDRGGEGEFLVPTTPIEKAQAGKNLITQANNGVPVLGIKGENSTPRHAAQLGGTPTQALGRPPTSGRNGSSGSSGLLQLPLKICTQLESPLNVGKHVHSNSGGLGSLGLSSPSSWLNMPLSCSNGEVPPLTPNPAVLGPPTTFPSSTRSTDSLTFNSADFDFEQAFPDSSKSELHRKNSLGLLHDPDGYGDFLNDNQNGFDEGSNSLRNSREGLNINVNFDGNDSDIFGEDTSHYLGDLSPGFKKEANAAFFADDNVSGTDHAVQNMLRLNLES